MAEGILIERPVNIFQHRQEANIVEMNVFMENQDEELLVGEEERGESLCFSCRAVSNSMLEAVSSNHVTCLKEILRTLPANLDKPQLSYGGVSLSHVAARKGSAEALRLLVEYEPSLAFTTDYKGATPLHISAQHNQLKCLRYLLYNTSCSSPNLRDYDGATPLHSAANAGSLKCLRELHQSGKANVNATTNSGETPAYFAAQNGHLDCLHYLVDTARADISIASYDGMTPLHIAAHNGQLKVAHWLVKMANCSVNVRTSDGTTPVHFAAAKGHVMILEWLIHHKLATGLERDDYGATPIHDAAEHGRLECLHVFYNNSIKMDIEDGDGFTPKDMAMEKGHLECAAFISHPRHHLQNWIHEKKQLSEAWQISQDEEGKYKELEKRKKPSLKRRISLNFFSRMKVGLVHMKHSQ
jgi:ankyrin repeat protein